MVGVSMGCKRLVVPAGQRPTLPTEGRFTPPKARGLSEVLEVRACG